MELSIAALGDLVRNAEILFMKGLDSVTMVARNSGMFRIDDISDHKGNTKEYSEIDLEEYADVKLEGDQASRARVQQGYSKVGTLYRVSKDIGITYEMRHYNKYIDVISRLTNLGALAGKRMELDLQLRITFATATSYTSKEGLTIDTTVGDTLALASTVHTVRGSSTTFRNRLANNPLFSRGSLEGMEQMVIENSINQFGEKVTIPYDIIWTTEDANTVNTVREYLKSTASPDALNSGVVNVYSGKYKHVILPRVAVTSAGANDATKAKYWGLASTMNSQAFLGINEEAHMKEMNATGANLEFSTEDLNLGCAAGYFIVIPGARWFTISTGDAVA
tara:strand:- start:2440 stop:3447 length:1008 start_codon:yes stop_codon:yes gene_type:complete